VGTGFPMKIMLKKKITTESDSTQLNWTLESVFVRKPAPHLMQGEVRVKKTRHQDKREGFSL
jgi:hypothetical protein